LTKSKRRATHSATAAGHSGQATLTLGDNRRVDLSQCIIILTRTLGATEMTDLVDGAWASPSSGGSRQQF